jgi:hypothetical protein
MSGVTELVIGGVALAGLFDTCMNMFERIDAGKNCGRDYQEAALKITLLGNRLSRWEDIYHQSELSSTPREGYLAEAALQSINMSLNRLCKASDRYQPSNGSSKNIAGTTEKLQTMTLSKTKINLGSKIVWALHDKKDVNEVILSVRFKIEELESLTSKLVPFCAQALTTHAKIEAEDFIHQGSIEGPETTIPAIQAAAAAMDPCFNEAVSQVTGHRYSNIETTGNARVHLGDAVMPGYNAKFSTSQHIYNNVRTSGCTIQQSGNIYGKTIFD